MLNLEESKYALSKILEVLMSPWQPGINYDNLKAAADRHTRRIEELESTGICDDCLKPPTEKEIKSWGYE